jgi:hypothetical protein
MRVEIVDGVVYDMTTWPLITLTVRSPNGLLQDRKLVIDGIVNVLGKTILSAANREMKFNFRVDFVIPVYDMFNDLAPFVLEFAMAMARPDIFEASKSCMVGSCVRFHNKEDAEMVHAVAQLIAHVPQGAPVTFEMVES